ncbi:MULTISPECIES: SNF2 helicase associated domain-containing protein [unclassified Clostridium]|uniref:DEAD/DEAH box helicase n=1 Tax=unclassified Clostridium TaxID=2614128 RepID=UPI0002983976|nr:MULTISPECIES: SNF2 helicase associated domain-containing protein [unclassified Clostridium]EKQ57275.1 MAG: DNA/RNA helicase, superfamily II, SNF2 family [Clostridium sp. Maddingley MBC34-26]
MIKQILLEGFSKNITNSILAKGQRVLKNDLLRDLNINVDNDYIKINSFVVSESLFNEYSCKIEIDNITKDIIGTHCSCLDFEKNEFSKDNYCCKHLVATFYSFLREIDEDENLRSKITNVINFKDTRSKLKENNNDDLLSLLIGDTDKDKLKFDIIINKNNWSSKLQVEFKIGLKSRSNKMYIVKDINSFLISIYNNVPIKYGKDFILDLKKQSFSFEDKRLIKFINNIKTLAEYDRNFRRHQDKLIEGKTLTIPDIMFKEFLNIVKKNRIFLGDGFFYRILESEIIEGDMPIPFALSSKKDIIELKAPNGIPEPLTQNEDVFLYGTSIYIPTVEQCERLSPYIKIFNATNQVSFNKSNENKILTELIPSVQKVTNDLTLSKEIRDKVVIGPVNFSFYFDKDKDISLLFKVSYEGHEFNYFDEYKDKIIYRDVNKEHEALGVLKSLGFEEVNGRLYFFRDDEDAFRFFKYEIEKIQKYGEVFYSERFKGIKDIKKSDFKGEVRKGKYNYFEFEFKIADLSYEETAKILRSFRDNLKYYKLGNGEFLDLEEASLKEALILMDNLLLEEELNNNLIEVPMNKAAYLEDYLEDKNMRFIKGCEEIKVIKDRLKNIKDKSFQPPYGLQAKLREYQKDGYNWFRTLDYLGFGGILGDEMGLGKTLQTITLLLSKPNSKTIIIAPTSLIYNWKNEFRKFAPSMKIAISNGARDEREKLIKNYKEYDVIITTYNLLRRDLELYDMEFDYCILDEAQNIKNQLSLSAKSVKEIKSRNRFALTGTPIENSLMELWSIFDFIMPGYLYSEKKFVSRYYRRLEEGPEILEELNRLVKPFILRRYKKNVIKELPDKIEKRLLVPLSDEQKVVYETYANYVKDLIQKKVEDFEFTKNKIEILSYITKLRQICLDPSVTMDNYLGTSGKIDALIELLEQSIEEGHKILVFSQFTSVLKNIGKILKEKQFEFSYLDGSVSSINRIKMVDEFNNGEKNVFLVSLKAGGTGLNLTSADIVIHFDPWWNPAVEDQATDRAHRIGQKNVVEVIKLISSGTIEEKIVELQDSKRELINKILSDDLSVGTFINTLNENEILDLFNYSNI